MVKKPRERDETDKSLRVEREKTDAELATGRKSIADRGDRVVRVARAGAAAVVERARAKADRKSGDSILPTAGRTVTEDREREDAALRAEYRTADAQTTREREEPVVAITAALDVERVATDHRLHLERDSVDAALASRDEALRATEEQLRQAQKMEAIGRLAGGVAHDFNNLLSVILSYASLAIESLIPGDPLRDDIQEIETAGKRATELTAQLLAFSRQQVLAPKVIDLNASLDKMAKMLGRVLGEDIALERTGARSVWPIKVDPCQVDQIVMNLAVNARDAMPSGGKLTLETSNVELDERYVRTHPGTRVGPHVVLAVSDTGVGMDRATQARIFEPFFTTKKFGKGTGLGLATVFGIAQQSGGAVLVHSEPGHGTTFKVYFPRTEQPIEPDAVRGPNASTGARPGEMLLVVEDDGQLRQLVLSVLRRAGFEVLVAGSPADALALSQQYTGNIHLLLTDVIMPGMDGGQLADRIKAARPEVKVLFMSGYTGDVVLNRGVAHADGAFLQKPITPAALLRSVHEALHGAQGFGAPSPSM